MYPCTTDVGISWFQAPACKNKVPGGPILSASDTSKIYSPEMTIYTRTKEYKSFKSFICTPTGQLKITAQPFLRIRDAL